VARLDVVRVAMGYELYPRSANEQTTLRATLRAKGYKCVIRLGSIPHVLWVSTAI